MLFCWGTNDELGVQGVYEYFKIFVIPRININIFYVILISYSEKHFRC